MICWNCGNTENMPGKPGRNDLCPECNSYLRCCYNCDFYDRSAHNECREPQAEWVKDKEKGNYCGYFKAGAKRKEGVPGRKKLSGEDAAKKWEALFKKK